jgi:hypothetical protein
MAVIFVRVTRRLGDSCAESTGGGWSREARRCNGPVEVRKSLSERLRRIEGPVTSRQGSGRERSRTAERSDTCHKTFTTRSGLWTVGRQGNEAQSGHSRCQLLGEERASSPVLFNVFCFGLLIYKSAPANRLLPRHNPVHVIRQTPRKPPSTVVTQKAAAITLASDTLTFSLLLYRPCTCTGPKRPNDNENNQWPIKIEAENQTKHFSFRA